MKKILLVSLLMVTAIHPSRGRDWHPLRRAASVCVFAFTLVGQAFQGGVDTSLCNGDGVYNVQTGSFHCSGKLSVSAPYPIDCTNDDGTISSVSPNGTVKCKGLMTFGKPPFNASCNGHATIDGPIMHCKKSILTAPFSKTGK